ncbi:MAG TPA: metal-sulfur cluster assembly factor [Candidatus Nanoarchaeia archaeon]|nr:metal-sulfur cluster assembly factor [Candidatus Nanoarchaeia archaeon]
MATNEQIIEMLKTVNDPEIGVDVYTLGLIYDISIKDEKTVDIKMTFTSVHCPYGPLIVEEIEKGLKDQLKFSAVNVNVVFEPKWEPSEELKAALGIGGL